MKSGISIFALTILFLLVNCQFASAVVFNISNQKPKRFSVSEFINADRQLIFKFIHVESGKSMSIKVLSSELKPGVKRMLKNREYKKIYNFDADGDGRRETRISVKIENHEKMIRLNLLSTKILVVAPVKKTPITLVPIFPKYTKFPTDGKIVFKWSQSGRKLRDCKFVVSVCRHPFRDKTDIVAEVSIVGKNTVNWDSFRKFRDLIPNLKGYSWAVAMYDRKTGRKEMISGTNRFFIHSKTDIFDIKNLSFREVSICSKILEPNIARRLYLNQSDTLSSGGKISIEGKIIYHGDPGLLNRVEVSIDGGASYSIAKGTIDWKILLPPQKNKQCFLKFRAVDIYDKIHTSSRYDGFMFVYREVRNEQQIRKLVAKMEDYYEKRNQSGYMSLFSRDFYSPVVGLETYQDVYSYVREDFNRNSDIKILTSIQSIKNAGNYYLVTVMENFEATWMATLVKYVENYTYSFRVKKYGDQWKIIRFNNFRGTFAGGSLNKTGSIKARW